MSAVPLVIIIIVIIIFFYYYCYRYLRQRGWGGIVFVPVCLSVCLFVCLSVCEHLPDHNFSCGVMKLPGINCYVKVWK